MKTRIFGLDLLRSVAILLVVFVHGRFLLLDFFKFPKWYLPDGVDLFFVLSGFLVGSILINQIQSAKKIDLYLVLNFYKRRWYRTLPNYYLFLGVNILLIYFNLIPGFINKYLTTFFVFFQNFYKPFDFLFWESWSLSVEEWFYLLFPLIMLVGYMVLKNKVLIRLQILTAILLFILFPFLYRMWFLDPNADFDLYYRKLVLTRLDTIGFGLIGAYVYSYHEKRFYKNKNLLFSLGLLLLLLFGYVKTANLTLFKIYYSSYVGISVLLLLPKLTSIKNEKIPLKPFNFISRISYSMYLIHMPVLYLLSKFVTVSTSDMVLFRYGLFWVLTLLLSYLVYNYYELPLMNLRDRKIRNNAKN